MSAPSAPTPSKKMFSYWKVLLPVLIGIGAVVLIIFHDAGKENIGEVMRSIRFTPRVYFCIALALLFTFGRVFGLSWRFRALTDRQLHWRQAIKVDLLCEFTSCVTPTTVGGSSLGMVFLNSEGIEIGRATTLMITTLFLDELFMVVACPIVILLTPGDMIFASGAGSFSEGIRLTFWIVYGAIVVWTFILFTGIIWKPEGLRRFAIRLFSIRWLRKWQPKAVTLTDNMVATSHTLRQKPLGFWAEAFGGTALSWISRYLVVNALFFGFLPQDDPYQWIIMARQFVIWVLLLVSPTPGGSGLSEWLFSEYYGDLVATAGMALILAIFWRLISYYIYLLLGAIVVPKWLSETIARAHRHREAKQQIENKTES